MKSERRHELATNELADWIANFPQWFNENLTTIIIGAVVVIGLIGYAFFYYSRESRLWNTKDAQIAALLDQLHWQKQTVLEGKQKGIAASDIFINMASGYQLAAEDTQNQPLSALAMIKRAEALRTELHYRPKPAEQDVRKYQIQQAMKIYAQALEKSKESPTTAAMAEYGIALCLEDMGDFAKAKAAYEKIAQADEYKGTLYQARAQLRLSTLSDNQGMVIFVKSQTAEPNTPRAIKPLSLDEPLVDIEAAIGKELDFNSVK
jgi:tetratricopeptide (TPR) repeat protein